MTETSVRMWRLRRRKAEYPVLPRPLRRQIGEARNPHAVRESAVNSRFDEIGCEKGERDRHIHFADAAALAFRDALCSCSCVRGKFLEPTASAGNRRDQQGASFGADRTRVLRWHSLRHKNLTAPFSRRLLPRNLDSAFAMDCIRSSKFDNQPLSLNLNTRDMTFDDGPVIHWL